MNLTGPHSLTSVQWDVSNAAKGESHTTDDISSSILRLIFPMVTLLNWYLLRFCTRFLDTLTRLHACVLLNLRDFPTLLGKDQQRSRFQHCPPRWCEHGQSSFQRNQWTVKKVLTTREAGRLLDKNIPFVCNVTNIYCELEKYWRYFSQLRKHQRKSSWMGTGRGKYHSENPNLQKWWCWVFGGIETYLNGCIQRFEHLFVLYFHQC